MTLLRAVSIGALLVAATPAMADEQLLPPVAGACISSPYGPRVLAGRPHAGTYHYGIDMPAPAGAAVRAVAPGRIMRVQRKGPGGLEVLMQHQGFVGIYSHLGMLIPAFAEGKSVVAAGEKFAVVGHSGVTYGMHVYFEMLVDNRPVDPAPFFGLSPCSAGAPQRQSATGSPPPPHP